MFRFGLLDDAERRGVTGPPVRVLLLPLAALLALLMLSATSSVASAQASSKTATFTAAESGEALLDLTARAPETGWGKEGAESAVATVKLDGEYSQDVVLFAGRERFTYRVALGAVSAGQHTVEVDYSKEKSPKGAKGIEVGGLVAEVVPTGSVPAGEEEKALVHRYSPILYGRDLPDSGGRYENNHTDVPLLMYHTLSRDPATGNVTIEYTAIWSNEDGGTDTPALMARYGRTTDIEWVYRVTLTPDGVLVPGSEEYQGPGHATLKYTGVKEGDHPLLVTTTNNNNQTQYTPANDTGYRFFMDPSQELPEGRAREVMMDENPWTYQIMSRELVREGEIEHRKRPAATPDVSDTRNYLYVEFDKDTETNPPGGESTVGTAIGVKLKGHRKLYTSHHNIPDRSITRDVPAATAIELPQGTKPEDVQEVRALGVPLNLDGTDVPRDYRIDFTSINHAFFLDGSYRPKTSFIEWRGNVVLTDEDPEAVVWTGGR